MCIDDVDVVDYFVDFENDFWVYALVDEDFCVDSSAANVYDNVEEYFYHLPIVMVHVFPLLVTFCALVLVLVLVTILVQLLFLDHRFVHRPYVS